MTRARGTILMAGALIFALVVLPWAAAAEDVSASPDESAAKIEAQSKKVQEQPGDIEALIDLGNLYYEGNMLDQALTTYLEAAKIDSTHVGALLNLGAVYADMGRLMDAIPYLERALKLAPGNAMIMTNLGSTFYGLQRFGDAADMYRRALEADPNNVEAHFNLGVAFADAQIFNEAIREWKTVIEIDPEGSIAKTCRENIAMIEEFTTAK
jgi:tetratricopeptide (TPR) repeat protein